MRVLNGLFSVAVLLALASPAGAITISIDEFGTGFTDTGARLAINSPTYTVTNPLTYTVPFTFLTQGFIQLCEEGTTNCNGNNPESDIIQFQNVTNTGTHGVIKFWSVAPVTGDVDQPGVLADTGIPQNVDISLQFTEIVGTGALAGFTFFDYTPAAGTQAPGLVSGQSTTYHIVSEGRLTGVPEPTSFLLLGSGLAGLAAWRYRARKTGTG